MCLYPLVPEITETEPGKLHLNALRAVPNIIVFTFEPFDDAFNEALYVCYHILLDYHHKKAQKILNLNQGITWIKLCIYMFLRFNNAAVSVGQLALLLLRPVKIDL